MTQNELKLNEVYNGFKVVDISEISEYKSVGILLKHEITGLEVFHMLNEDEENLFPQTPTLKYTFTADNDGYYHIWINAKAKSSGGDSIWVKFDNDNEYIKLNGRNITFLNKGNEYIESSYEELDNVSVNIDGIVGTEEGVYEIRYVVFKYNIFKTTLTRKIVVLNNREIDSFYPSIKLLGNEIEYLKKYSFREIPRDTRKEKKEERMRKLQQKVKSINENNVKTKKKE